MTPSATIVPQELDGSREIREAIISLRKHLGQTSLDLAYLLKRVKEERIYQDWDYDSFESALADPEISISRSTAYGLIQVWDTWVEKYQLPSQEVSQVPYDKLLLIAPIVDDANHEEMFENAKSLSRQDIMHLKMERRANASFPEFKPMPQVWRCLRCGKWAWDAQSEDLCDRSH